MGALREGGAGVKAEPRVTLAEARTYIDRALDKARELGLAGTVAVVDAGGNLISLTRLPGSPASGVPTSRGKAMIAAVTHAPTVQFAERMDEHPVRFMSYLQILPSLPFPGPGGVPIRRDGQVVGGIATGPGIGGHKGDPTVDPSKLTLNGEVVAQGNAEDVVISHALEQAYLSQH